jgi:BlaI family penicillinase repressor
MNGNFGGQMDVNNASFLAGAGPDGPPRERIGVAKALFGNLSRRERQIMDLLFQRGRATAAEVQEGLPEAPSYSAVRALLRILEDKGHVRHEQDGPRYVYIPKADRERARQSALKHVVQTFFDGSAEQAMAALLGTEAPRMAPVELERLAALIEQARKEDV